MTGHAVLEFIQRGDWARTPAVPPRLMLGVATVAAATVAGAWLAGRRRGHPEIWFAAAAGVLLVIAGMHLLPDAWVDAGAARIWPGLVALTAVGAFAATGLAARAGCGCQQHKERASGTTTAVALATHRFLEGSAIVLAGSAAVTIALGVHAFAEGLATATLLGGQPRRLAGWLAVMSLSPVAGAAAAGMFAFPTAAGPMLLALAAGVLAQAARVSLRGAFHVRTSRFLLSRRLATVTMAAIMTALAVHAAG